MSERYVVAGSRPWNRRTFERRLHHLPGRWTFVDDEVALAAAVSEGVRAAFFLHWSRKVPESILTSTECVNFHMTDVPFGRGGSPLQNLIHRGHDHTVLSALRMTTDLDAGPVYAKRPLCLRGTAEEVYIRAGEMAADVITEMQAAWPEPAEQVGEPVPFRRRSPLESAIGEHADLDGLHDFIRMLDADGYPKAFFEHGGFRYEFRRSNRYDGRIEADVRITALEEGSS